MVLGASGRTGQLIVRDALAAGYGLRALVRDKRKIMPLKGLDIHVGSPLDANTIAAAMNGADAVIVALASGRRSEAPWAKSVGPKNLFEVTTRNLLRAGATRIVAISAAGVGDSLAKAPRLIKFLARYTDLAVAFNDHARADQLLTASGCNFTIIRPTGLTNQLDTQPILISNATDTSKPKAWISRTQVASFAVLSLKTTEYDRQAVIISSQ